MIFIVMDQSEGGPVSATCASAVGLSARLMLLPTKAPGTCSSMLMVRSMPN
jgi:hypothetical protein